MNLLITYISAMFPVLLCAGLGYMLARRTNWLESESLPTLVTNIGLPALILDAMLRMDTPLMELSDTVAATVLILALSAVLGVVVLKSGRLSVRGYLPMLVNPNAGNLGIPLVYALLGSEALVYAVLVSTIVQISHFTFGVAVLSGRFHLKSILGNWSVLSLIAGGLWQASDLPKPEPVLSALDMLAGMALPVMLLLLGKSIAGINVRELNRLWRIVGLSLARIGIGAASALVVVSLWPMPPIVQQTLLLQAIMPVAVLSYLLATHYEGPKDDIAAIILVSTPLSLLAVFVVQAYLF